MSAERLRIALVAPRYPPALGGVETHVERLAEQAAARGHAVEVLTHAVGPAPARATPGVVVRRFPLVADSAHYPASPALWRHLARSGGRYDVVHAHNYHALPALAACRADAPLVFTPHYHGTSASPFRRLLHRPYRRAGARIVRRAAAVICVSGREAALLAGDFPFAAGRVEVIPNGVDRDALDAAAPFASAGPVVLSAGRLEDYKQVDRIVAAVAHLPEPFVLRVTGDGPMRPALERLVGELGLDGRVALLGRVGDAELHRWFKTASVFVTLSRIEAMPITPLEVLAAGARVVASDIDAHREVAQVTRGSVALVPADVSAEDLAAAIVTAAGAPARPADVLAWSEVGARTEAVYRRAVTGS